MMEEEERKTEEEERKEGVAATQREKEESLGGMLCGGAVWTLEGQEDVVFVTACSQSATEAWGHGDSRCPLTGAVTRPAPRAGRGHFRGNQQVG